MNRKSGLIALLTAAIICLLVLVFFIYRHNDAQRKAIEDANAQYTAISEQLSEILGETQADESETQQHTEAPASLQTQPLETSPAFPAPGETEQETKAAAALQESEIPQESEPASGEAPEPEEANEALTEGSTETQAPLHLPEHFVIFVGDSRTVGMGEAEAKLHPDDPCVYIGEPGEGYNWFIETGLDQMDTAIRTWPDAPVVFNLGVNDCDKISAYIEVYHDLEKGYPDTDFYYMSVNPVTEDSVHVPLSDILEFNSRLKAAFPARYIDTCSWMIAGGFEDVDGVHYSREQYCKIHDFAVRYLAGARRSG